MFSGELRQLASYGKSLDNSCGSISRGLPDSGCLRISVSDELTLRVPSGAHGDSKKSFGTVFEIQDLKESGVGTGGSIRWAPDLPRLEPVLVDLQASDPRLKGRARNAEFRRGAGWT